MDKYPGKFKFSVSHTTRKIRENEVDGSNYYYISQEKFLDVSCLLNTDGK